jgi:predicted O-linked N-acetylglucosamine transferase (SPINDLY family)
MNPSPDAQLALQRAQEFQRAGRLAEAEAECRRSLAVAPQSADVTNLLGIVLCQLGRIAEGVALLEAATQYSPENPAIQTNLGNALAAQGNHDCAILAYRRALSLRPELPDAWNNLGNALQERGDAIEAIAAHRRAIELRPDFAQAHYNLAAAYKLADSPDDAIFEYDRALSLRPAYPQAEANRAATLKDIGRLDDAIAGYHRTMRLAPSAITLGALIYCLYFHPDYDSRRIWEYLQRFERDYAQPLAREIRPHANDRSPERKLCVGYVSPDFSEHPAGRFLLPLLKNHDHNQVEVFCYSDLRKPDAMTHRLRACADQWRDTSSLTDAQLAGQIRADRIDIVIDLSQHLANNRLLAFARRPAPVQVTWLGYPGSTGVAAIDYRLSDPYLDPLTLFDPFYSERTYRLPDCYWCYEPMVEPMEVGPLPASKNGFITFACLNNFAKVTGATIELWARTMNRVPGSRLVVLAPKGSARSRFLERMEAKGITSERVEFVGRMGRPQYMSQYQRIDVTLDTWPCNGHTTSFDSFWMGVPVVTMTGQTAMSRGGASILANLGMPELISDAPGEFVEKSAALASNLARLATLRTQLRGKIESSALMDGRRFARNIETVYREMWKNHISGTEPNLP